MRGRNEIADLGDDLARFVDAMHLPGEFGVVEVAAAQCFGGADQILELRHLKIEAVRLV